VLSFYSRPHGSVVSSHKNQPIAFLPMANDPDVIRLIPDWIAYMRPATAAPSRFSIRTIQTIIGSLRTFPVQHAIHGLAVDPSTHRLYKPEQEEDHKPVARMVVYEAVTAP
jgi:hypothetical protein